MTQRLGILGGMFDPVHTGHIEMARCALRLLDLDSLRLVPCHVPNHRAAATASGAHRLAMLELATSDETGMVVDPIEINRATVSYSVDTLTALRAAPFSGSLVFVMGMDAFNSLPQWHQWQRLLELCHVFVLARDGKDVLPATAEAVNLAARRVHAAAEMFAAKHGNIWIVEGFASDVSSTRVRAAIREKHNLETLLNDRVIEYINQHNLYS